ncbi:hypothetical protein J4E83_006003 [Alternaria metachromatica]|uniref:uncharacterized protein n=1 Tax=Alternaria metachromatica TaxID=283354 RepID=UPI0020C33D5F|nr:uncharacterized protein J4E83_006003 [Alternaria metachromatica]KAI4619051.1 hypothetical protein J4E83_006003 [Alternaria metachromatica]
MIYDYSLEPRAIFRHTNREDQREQNQGYDLPETDSSKEDPQMILDMMYQPEVADEDLPVPDELYDEFWHDPNGPPSLFSDSQEVMLTYKIFMSTPLLLVSKEVNREAGRVLKANKRGWINYYNEVARSNIHYHRIIKPSKAFQYLWSRSQVVLENTTEDTLFFLQILPEVLKKSLHNVDQEGLEFSDDTDDYEVGDDEYSERYKQPLDGVEEPISPTSIGSAVWRDLGMERVVKITRSQTAA